MKLNKLMGTIGKVAQIRFSIISIVIGLLFAAIGGFIVYKNVTNPTTYESIEATVTEVLGESTTNTNEYDVILTYYVNDEPFVQPFTTSIHETGSKITIYYDVQNPNNIQSSANDNIIVPIIFLAVGLCVIAVGVVTLIKAVKEKDFDQQNQVDMSNVSEEQILEIKENSEPSKQYYFHFCGKMNQSYVLETPERMPIITMNCEKVGVINKSKFVFTNKITLSSKEYEVGHTTTVSYGGGGFSIPVKSSFKINNEDVFKLIASKGYSIESKIEGLSLNFDISHYGVLVATLRAGGANIAKGGKSKLGEIPTVGVFTVEAKESDLDMVALIAFAVSRVEFF